MATERKPRGAVIAAVGMAAAAQIAAEAAKDKPEGEGEGAGGVSEAIEDAVDIAKVVVSVFLNMPQASPIEKALFLVDKLEAVLVILTTDQGEEGKTILSAFGEFRDDILSLAVAPVAAIVDAGEEIIAMPPDGTAKNKVLAHLERVGEVLNSEFRKGGDVIIDVHDAFQNLVRRAKGLPEPAG